MYRRAVRSKSSELVVSSLLQRVGGKASLKKMLRTAVCTQYQAAGTPRSKPGLQSMPDPAVALLALPGKPLSASLGLPEILHAHA